MLQLAEFSVWITTNGVVAPTYAIELSSDRKSASGWIPSEVGVPFTVNWHNAWRGSTIQSVLIVDGVACEPNVMLDANLAPSEGNTMTISQSWTPDSFTMRNFVFPSVPDPSGMLHSINTQYTFGNITLELWAMQATSAECYFLAPNSTPTFGNVNGFRLHNAPLHTFTFRYQPVDMLMANGIIPRFTLGIGAIDADPHRRAMEIRRLEARLQVLRQASMMPTSPPALPIYSPLSHVGSDAGIPNVQLEVENVGLPW